MTTPLRRIAFITLLLLTPAIAPAQPPEVVRVAVLAHPIARGDLLAPSDFTEEERAISQARNALHARDCAGLEARRALSAGAVVTANDLMPQQLVRRGEPVMIRVVSGGMTISASGRALSNGAKGEMVRVVTTTTNRTIDGVVESAGSVRIVAP